MRLRTLCVSALMIAACGFGAVVATAACGDMLLGNPGDLYIGVQEWWAGAAFPQDTNGDGYATFAEGSVDLDGDLVFGDFEANAIGISNYISFTADAVVLGKPVDQADIPDPPPGGAKNIDFVKYKETWTDLFGNEHERIVCSVQKKHYCLTNSAGGVVGSGQYK